MSIDRSQSNYSKEDDSYCNSSNALFSDFPCSYNISNFNIFLWVFVMLLHYFKLEHLFYGCLSCCYNISFLNRPALMLKGMPSSSPSKMSTLHDSNFKFSPKKPFSCWLIFTHSDPGSHVSTRSAHFSAFMFRVFESNWNLMVLLSKIHAVCTVGRHSLLRLWQLLKSCKLCDTD